MPEHDGARRAAAPGERPGARRQRRLALAAAAAVVLPAVAAGLPAARRAVAGLLGAASAETSSGVLRGERTDLDGARARAGFELVVPAFPDEVRLEPGGVVTFVYAARPGLPALRGGRIGALFSQFRARLDLDHASEVAPLGEVRSVEVAGVIGYWVPAGQTVIYRLPQGGEAPARKRLGGNALVWERAGISYRFESRLGLARTLAFLGGSSR